MSDRITIKDLRGAVEAHKVALEAAGITFDGRLILSEGSKTYGIAYRLNLTDVDEHCQCRLNTAGEQQNWNWDHADCMACHGSTREICSGHFSPPVGGDYLGMTAREAYENLTTRTATLWDVARHLENK